MGTGTLIVKGGSSIAGNAYFGGNIFFYGNLHLNTQILILKYRKKTFVHIENLILIYDTNNPLHKTAEFSKDGTMYNEIFCFFF